MNRKIVKWIEEDYFQNPSFFGQLLSMTLLPLTLIYCLIVGIKRFRDQKIDFGIPIISIGNLTVGGNGKTPLTIQIAKNQENIAIILRGYGRTSKDLVVVSHNRQILCNVKTSGDEAFMIAKELPNATVIVSANRKLAILKAKELGCKKVILDDGFSRTDIKKFDILIKPKDEPKNIFCIPSGPYREPKFIYAMADLILEEGVDFKKKVTFYDQNLQQNVDIFNFQSPIVVITAIAKPFRLKEFLPKDTIIESFSDHHFFEDSQIEEIFAKYPKHTFATTQKDAVKLEKYLQKFIIIKLELELLNQKIPYMKA